MYNKILPSALVLAGALTTAVQSAKFELPIHFSNSYAVVKVQAGTPSTEYVLLFDTGSSTSWFVDDQCAESCPNGSGYARVGYNASGSSTSADLDAYGVIEYSGGVTSGPAVSDVFTLESLDSGAITWNQTFLSANDTNWRFIPADGFLGLAFSTISPPKTKTVVETMMQQGLLDEPRFAIYYGTELFETGENPNGVLTIGASEEEKYVDGDLTWVPLRLEIETQVWRVSINSITGTKTATNGSKISTTQNTEYGRLVFDTGAGSLGVPPEIINELYESIGWNYTAILWGDHKPLCTEFDAWNVSLSVGFLDQPITLEIIGSELRNPGFANNPDYCFPPFQDSEGEGFFLFGTPLLHQFYTVWDFGANEPENYNGRVGFGKLKSEYKP